MIQKLIKFIKEKEQVATKINTPDLKDIYLDLSNTF